MCRCTEWHYAEWHFALCHHTEWHYRASFCFGSLYRVTLQCLFCYVYDFTQSVFLLCFIVLSDILLCAVQLRDITQSDILPSVLAPSKLVISKPVYFNEFKMGSSSTEQYCLRWNDFHSNVANAFSDIRDEEDFLDVTLVSNQLLCFAVLRTLACTGNAIGGSITVPLTSCLTGLD